MEWGSERVRDAISPSCTTAGRSGTFFLWGDSFAQSLSYGLRQQLPDGVALAQVATSLCAPATKDFDRRAPGNRCERSGLFALESIERLRPALVILAQAADHGAVNWRELSAQLLARGAGHVLVVGPFPIWMPSLPSIFARDHWADRAAYLGHGLDTAPFGADAVMAAALSDLPGVTYLSLLDQLCRNGACLARVPGEDQLDLMTFDFGHLTPQGVHLRRSRALQAALRSGRRTVTLSLIAAVRGEPVVCSQVVDA